MIRAVTFDFWETLVSEGQGIDAEEDGSMRSRQLASWRRTLGGAGWSFDEEAIERAFDRNWEVFHESWRENVQHGRVEATLLICEMLGVDPPDDVRQALLDTFDEAGRGAPLRTAPGIEGCLRNLSAAGVRIGIVCDVGMTPAAILRERLQGFGILAYFDHWSFSDEVGCFKPFPGIFEHALKGLGVDDPASAVHVGDGRRTDMAGALAMGMTAVRYTHFNDPPPDTGPEGHHILSDHAELPATLGLV